MNKLASQCACPHCISKWDFSDKESDPNSTFCAGCVARKPKEFRLTLGLSSRPQKDDGFGLKMSDTYEMKAPGLSLGVLGPPTSADRGPSRNRESAQHEATSYGLR